METCSKLLQQHHYSQPIQTLKNTFTFWTDRLDERRLQHRRAKTKNLTPFTKILQKKLKEKAKAWMYLIHRFLPRKAEVMTLNSRYILPMKIEALPYGKTVFPRWEIITQRRKCTASCMPNDIERKQIKLILKVHSSHRFAFHTNKFLFQIAKPTRFLGELNRQTG